MTRFPPKWLRQTLESRCADARKLAALGLGLTGGVRSTACLCRHLADDDDAVREMAEHALWSLWCRGGSPAANRCLAAGSHALGGRDVSRAITCFDHAIALCPTFGEAYNQRGMARYLLEDFAGAADDCRRCVALVPLHFAAWAGLGHALASLGEAAGAADAYARALEIHPRLACVRDMLDDISTLDRA